MNNEAQEEEEEEEKKVEELEVKVVDATKKRKRSDFEASHEKKPEEVDGSAAAKDESEPIVQVK